MDGCDWRMHRVDPRDLDSHMIRDVRHGMNVLMPWNYPRAETGSTLNHAVRFRAQFTPRNEYLRSIDTERLGTDHYTVKSFLYSFPRMAKNATEGDIVDYYHRINYHCIGFSVYVPPFATQTHFNHAGLWYSFLPAHCLNKWDFYDQILHQALVSSSSNLSDSDLTRHLVAEFSGYQILWLLAGIAGHPGLAFNNRQITMPRQGRDSSLFDYMQLWKHFLHIEHCRGITYSDIYFVETWLERLHSTYNDNLKPLILGLLRDCPLDMPVPIHFSPEHLINYITARASSIGIYSLKALTTPSTGTSRSKSSSSTSTTTAKTRQIAYEDIRLMDHDIPGDIYATVCSLMATASQTCDLCRASDHLVASCPSLHRILSDEHKTRRLLAALERGRSSGGGSTNPSRVSTRARTPPSSNRSAPRAATTRQLLADDNDTDEDVSIRQLTDDEPESATDDESLRDSDF